MKIYLIAPELTIGSNELVSAFFDAYKAELEKQIETSVVVSQAVLYSAAPHEGDAIIFFNKHENEPVYSQGFLAFMRAAITAKCEIFPIAIASEYRRPAQLMLDRQSYDIQEQLRSRQLSGAQVATVGIAFSRHVLASLQPTLCADSMALFLSYRRLDGENVSGSIYDLLRRNEQNVFRDLNKVLVGEDAQQVIEKNLRSSDAVVFLDTPKSGESEWIARELRYALALNLPIIWVRLGSDKSRVPLPVRPADKPHLTFDEVDISEKEVDPSVVEALIHEAFRAYREHAEKIFKQLRTMESYQYDGLIELELLNEKRMEYEVKIPRENGRYHQRPKLHVIGLYGKRPGEAEHFAFKRSLENLGYECYPRKGYNYDAALLLTSMPLLSSEKIMDCHFTDSLANYIDELEKTILPQLDTANSHSKKGVIISGAFPDCEPQYQQAITNAVHAVTEAALKRGCTIIFGAHPTFQHLIFDTARIHRPTDFSSAVNMYISRHFASDPLISELEAFARINATEALGDRASSLTLMREKMINDPEAACMIVVGGKTARPNIPPGVDEEIDLAVKRGLPVYLIGSVGGRTAELAVQHEGQDEWGKLNNSSKELNRELLISPDYAVLAKHIFNDVFDALNGT